MRIIGLDQLKKLGILLFAIILGTALLEKLLGETTGGGAALFIALLLASPLAYVLREARRKKSARRMMRRARERTRVAAQPFVEE